MGRDPAEQDASDILDTYETAEHVYLVLEHQLSMLRISEVYLCSV